MSKKHFMRTRNDCYTCCLATVLGLEYEQVPRFFTDNGQPLGDWRRIENEFLAKHGLQKLTIEASGSLEDIQGLAIVAGLSATPEFREKGLYHAVVYKDGKLFHDPKREPYGPIEPEQVDLIFPIFNGAEAQHD